MNTLIAKTTAYRMMQGDYEKGKLSHAYLVHFQDERNLEDALRCFALCLFGENKSSRDGRLILTDGLTDCKLFPKDGKWSVAQVDELMEDVLLKPLERECKCYLLAHFDGASAIVQNKLLKVLEEPPEGVHFLLGATSLSPVLSTIQSRVKLLQIPPFSTKEIYEVISQQCDSQKAWQIAEHSGGILGRAQDILEGSWFDEVENLALSILTANTRAKVSEVALTLTELNRKQELLAEMNLLLFSALNGTYSPTNRLAEQIAACWKRPTLLFAIERLHGVQADIKLNGYFPTVLYDFMLELIKENEKWLKLSV